jgi:hypothetical protein
MTNVRFYTSYQRNQSGSGWTAADVNRIADCAQASDAVLMAPFCGDIRIQQANNVYKTAGKIAFHIASPGPDDAVALPISHLSAGAGMEKA